MSRPGSGLGPLLGSLALAAGLWFFAFYLGWGNFWFKISCSSAALAAWAFLCRPGLRAELRPDGRTWLWGLLSAAGLYLIFWLGQLISIQIFPFAAGQISGIYGQGQGTPTWLIALLLLLVTGPSEEIYWRGFLQRGLIERLGRRNGWLLATACYAGVHLWTLNFMLIGAAAVAGAFWGILYCRLGRLAPVVVSHSLWSAVIFAVLPLS